MIIYKVYQYVNEFDDMEIDHGYYLKLDKAIAKWESLVNKEASDTYKFNYELFDAQEFHYVIVSGRIYGVELIQVED